MSVRGGARETGEEDRGEAMQAIQNEQIMSMHGEPGKLVHQLSETIKPGKLVNALSANLVPKEWPLVHQKVELYIAVDRPMAICITVLSVGAFVAGALWSTGYLLRSYTHWKEFESAHREREREYSCPGKRPTR